MGPEAGGAQLLGNYRGWGAASSSSGRVPVPPFYTSGESVPPTPPGRPLEPTVPTSNGPANEPIGGQELESRRCAEPWWGEAGL